MEYFDILNEDGTRTGKIKERSLVHRDGDLHGSVRIYIFRKRYNSKKIEILLQKRSDNKDSFPGCFDVSSAGHVDVGEEFIDAAVRELKEELGIEAQKEDFIFLFTQKLMAKDVFHGSIFVSNEINNVYVLKDNVDVSYIHYEEDEIQDILWMDTKELLCNLQNANKKFCISLEEYEKVLKSLSII